MALRLFLLLLLVTGGGWYLYGVLERSRAKPNLRALPVLPQRAPDTRPRQVSFIVKRGDTFSGILSQFGVSRDVSNNVYRALKPLGLQAIFPGDSVILSFKKDTLSAFSVQSRLQNWYCCTLRGDSVTARKTPVIVTIYRCLVRGVLSTSLSEDLVKMGVGDACVAMFADIFAWDINFFVDPQKGDSFEIVVEKKYAEGRFTGYGSILAARYVNNGRVYTALGLRRPDGIFNYFDCNGKSLQKQFLKAPLRFSHISSRFTFRRRHPVLGIVRPHLGIDYAAPPGTPVYAAADGTVRFADFKGDNGRMVRIDHGGAYETYYGHLQAFAGGIVAGAHVKQGDCIGWVGESGLATGPHLDYRMTRGGSFVNPLTVSLPSSEAVTPGEESRFLGAKEEYTAVFHRRLANNAGCFVLDIQAKPASGAKTAGAETGAAHGG
jgi:murein DD-endopeptidase MepM/ murein hydrolase activator NlpD